MAVHEDTQRQIDFIREVIDATGARLPGSPEERRGAEIVARAFAEATGAEAHTETFTCHPGASIGAIPILGYGLLFGVTPLYFLSPIATAVLALSLLLFALVQIILYSGWLDFLFPRRTSQNVYSVLEPPGGTADYTILLSGHIDSSWGWPLAEKNPRQMWIKVPYGVVGGGVALVLSVLRWLNDTGRIDWAGSWTDWIVLLFVPGFWYVARFLTWDKAKGSPGAMDNLGGIAVALRAVRHLGEHPEEAPAGARILLVGFGAEECGLKGSRAFVRRHSRDGLLENVWMINPDGVGDDGQFHVVDGDLWLRTRYDEDLCRLAVEAMREAGAEPAGRIKTPVGGSDAASFSSAGLRAVTLIAQKPEATDYYHTPNDDVDRLEPQAFETMHRVCLLLIRKVDQLVREGRGRA